MANCCIIIPVYKEFASLNKNEVISLRQVYTVLGQYSIYLIAPKSLCLKSYIKQAETFSVCIKANFFEEFFFRGTDGYNKLLLSKKFYSRFANYEYMLICQTDSFVFKDELQYWCAKGYDYIGAPWFEGWGDSTDESQFVGVGNGGFSLKKTSSHLRVLNSFSYITSPDKVIKSRIKNVKGIFSLIKEVWGFFLDITLRNNTFHLLNSYPYHEDVFWGTVAPAKFSWFRVADEETAMKFSFETNPRKLFELNGKKLPFGCHGWEKYDPNFWTKYIF